MNDNNDHHAQEASALYSGYVMHQRLRPVRHRLRYRVFSLLLDVDELPALAQRLRLFSLNRFNLFSLHERDYGIGNGDANGNGEGNGEGNSVGNSEGNGEANGNPGLRHSVDQQLRSAGLATGGAIRLLTMPRILGYAFNPLSVYFCHAADGSLSAILYEVSNTFGQRHSYLIEVDAAAAQPGALIEQQCAKRLHVSPFLGLDMRYLFRIDPPDTQRASLSIGVAAHDSSGVVLNARFDAQRRVLSDAALAKAFFSHPLLTLKVVLAIHWEALRLFAKGLSLLPTPAPPVRPVTVIKSEDT